MSMVAIRDLRVDLEATSANVVDGIDFTIAAGEVLGLVGESGSGKSTIGAALLGDARRGARITAGSIVIDGQQMLGLSQARLAALRGSTVAYVPQDPAMALNPALRMGQQLNELFEFHASGLPERERGERLRTVLGEVGLPADEDFLARFPHQLSGGQQQRVTLAMAFLLRPRLIVLDEPTTALDVSTQAQVLRTVRDLCVMHRVAALYVSHDMAVVANLAHRILVLYSGRIVETGSAEQIFRDAAHPYTRALIAAVPTLAERRQLSAIPGETPVPADRPQGCPFHPRCPDVAEACATNEPQFVHVGAGQQVRCLRARELTLRPAVTASGLHAPAGADGGDRLLNVAHVNAFHGRRQILYDVSLELAPGECLALVGQSGCGKTTLARCIIGLHHQYEGGIAFRNEKLASRARGRTVRQRQAMQYIFQSPYNSLNPRRAIGDILREPLKVLFSIGGAEARARVSQALDRVSLSPSVAACYPGQLSGGERQRVAIARALVCQPEVLICDEITSALDVSVQAAIVALLRRLQEEEHLALLFVTHNLALVRTIADRVLTMHAGHLVEAGDTDQVLDRPSHAYTRELIADTPTLPEYAVSSSR